MGAMSKKIKERQQCTFAMSVRLIWFWARAVVVARWPCACAFVVVWGYCERVLVVMQWPCMHLVIVPRLGA